MARLENILLNPFLQFAKNSREEEEFRNNQAKAFFDATLNIQRLDNLLANDQLDRQIKQASESRNNTLFPSVLESSRATALQQTNAANLGAQTLSTRINAENSANELKSRANIFNTDVLNSVSPVLKEVAKNTANAKLKQSGLFAEGVNNIVRDRTTGILTNTQGLPVNAAGIPLSLDTLSETIASRKDKESLQKQLFDSLLNARDSSSAVLGSLNNNSQPVSAAAAAERPARQTAFQPEIFSDARFDSLNGSASQSQTQAVDAQSILNELQTNKNALQKELEKQTNPQKITNILTQIELINNVSDKYLPTLLANASQNLAFSAQVNELQSEIERIQQSLRSPLIGRQQKIVLNQRLDSLYSTLGEVQAEAKRFNSQRVK
jgi:hypothetical protein